MNFDVPSLLSAFVFSAIGFVYFSYGRKMARFWFMAAGMGLMMFGYFVDSLLWQWVIAGILSALPHVLRS